MVLEGYGRPQFVQSGILTSAARLFAGGMQENSNQSLISTRLIKIAQCHTVQTVQYP